MTEDVARTVHLSRQLGKPVAIGADDVDGAVAPLPGKLRTMSSGAARGMDPFLRAELWFLTGSQGLYGEQTLRQVAEQSQRVADILEAGEEIPVRVVWKPVLTEADAIRRVMGEANEDR